MKITLKFALLVTLHGGLCLISSGQDNNQKQIDFGNIRGDAEVSYQNYQEDSSINAQVPDQKSTLTAFTNLIYTRGKFSAGMRYESYLPVQLGYPDRFRGTGIGYRYANYSGDFVGITIGNYFEQFGNGLVFRSYEQRQLGIDNAMDGVRIKLNPFPGIYLKGVYGKMRYEFDSRLVNSDGIVRGADGEINVNQLIKGWENKPLQFSFGGSFMSKYQADNNPSLTLPENVGSWAGRFNSTYKDFSMFGEYAYKINDPSADNKYIYKSGQALLLNTTYAIKGFSISLDGKSIENFSYRIDRDAQLTDLNINFMPALCKQHTYNLAATLYPYATQPTGEVAIQGEVSYKIPKRSLIGGKYGTQITVNFARAYGMDTTSLNDINTDVGSKRLGYNNNFFSPGKNLYFQDFNLELKRKFNKQFKASYMYFNMIYDNDINQGAYATATGAAVKGDLYAQIHLVDLSYKINRKNNIRIEAQHLEVAKDANGKQVHDGNWTAFVMEYTQSPHWSIGLIDQYNYGNSDPDYRIHYLFGTVAYIREATRMEVGYGKRRAGLFCVGGVCRAVPASNGLTMTITTTF